jgi:hypothetical protein
MDLKTTQTSHGSFSSLVIMIRKLDGYRECVLTTKPLIRKQKKDKFHIYIWWRNCWMSYMILVFFQTGPTIRVSLNLNETKGHS